MDRRATIEAVKAAQSVMRTVFNVKVQSTGHWGTYTDTMYQTLDSSSQRKIDIVLEGFGSSLSDARELAKETQAETPPAQSSSKSGGVDPAKAERQRQNKERFENEVRPAVLRVAGAAGFAKPALVIAQLMHETGGGKSMAGMYNYGGIKQFDLSKPHVFLQTTERDSNGKEYSTSQPFRTFGSADEFADYLINKLLVRKYPGVVSATTVSEYMKAIRPSTKGGYATASVSAYETGMNRWLGKAV